MKGRLMTEAQRQLASKHGTPAVFAEAVRRAIGEISVDVGHVRASNEIIMRAYPDLAGRGPFPFILSDARLSLIEKSVRGKR